MLCNGVSRVASCVAYGYAVCGAVRYVDIVKACCPESDVLKLFGVFKTLAVKPCFVADNGVGVLYPLWDFVIIGQRVAYNLAQLFQRSKREVVLTVCYCYYVCQNYFQISHPLYLYFYKQVCFTFSSRNG